MTQHSEVKTERLKRPFEVVIFLSFSSRSSASMVIDSRDFSACGHLFEGKICKFTWRRNENVRNRMAHSTLKIRNAFGNH